MTRSLASALAAAALTASLAIAAPSGAAEPPAGTEPQVGDVRPDTPPGHRVVLSAGPELLALAAASRRSIFSAVVWRDGRLSLRGRVEDYSGRAVSVQRKACEACSWHRFDVTRTGKRGWFGSRIGAPSTGSTFWRARVAASDGYARSFSATWETFH